VPDELKVAVETYPLLKSAVTDVAGIRTMPGEATVLLLWGDLQSSTPDHAYVATSGKLTLHRLDGPKDTLESTEMSFKEVTSVAADGKVKPDTQSMPAKPFYFEWVTGSN